MMEEGSEWEKRCIVDSLQKEMHPYRMLDLGEGFGWAAIYVYVKQVKAARVVLVLLPIHSEKSAGSGTISFS